ncbi:MAG: hypothetical protein JSV42_07160 [Chloroflexota bacterium]|nr:MAG: hypothetical protein JSV42_07160 [Chloroflexota bacterium]
MASNASGTINRVTEVPTSKAGWAIFGIGAIYMLLMGWLSSWWVVPTIRQTGLEGLPGAAFFFFWQFAAPVGALLVAIGVAYVADVERSRKAVFIVGSLIVVTWLYLSMAMIREVISPIFGIGGGLISLAFLGFCWDWARSRPRLVGAARTGADFALGSQVFYLIAAWYLCGLLGAPTFLLRPEQAMTIIPENNAISLGTTILICLTLGSVLAFFSRRVTLQDR